MFHMIRFAAIYWDPKPEIFVVPVVNWPILWYGVLFAIGFAVGFPIFVSILTRFLGESHRKEAVAITDKLTLYMIVGTIVGARVGHFLFYEDPGHYLQNPMEIFKIWEGGLASHGAAVGIIVALVLFCRKLKHPKLNWIRLLDFVCVPTAFAAFCIRIGNFINQEILGTPSSLPWAVVFGHPADRSYPVPRHPVQLYEAAVYLVVFYVLWRLTFKESYLHQNGKLIGLFLILVFGFRFFVEFLKTEQSRILFDSPLTMGQMLSVPVVLLGIYFFARKR